MKRNSILIAGAAVSLIGVALAQGSMGGMGGMGAGSMPGMSMKMDMSSLEKLQGKAFDRAFLSMMVPHHQMALDMARAVLPVSKDAAVKTWANMVIKDQAREITQMNTLLKSYGGSDTAMANMMKTSMSGMADMVKKARNPDMAFVEGMVPHHASAIDMANMALEKSSDARVLKLSRDIVRAQAQEMYDFRTWLMKRGM